MFLPVDCLDYRTWSGLDGERGRRVGGRERLDGFQWMYMPADYLVCLGGSVCRAGDLGLNLGSGEKFFL